MMHLSGIRIAAAIVLFIVILGVGVKTTAHISMLFHDWLENIFQKSDVMELVPDNTIVNMGDSVYFSQKENTLVFTNEKEVYLVNLEK